MKKLKRKTVLFKLIYNPRSFSFAHYLLLFHISIYFRFDKQILEELFIDLEPNMKDLWSFLNFKILIQIWGRIEWLEPAVVKLICNRSQQSIFNISHWSYLLSLYSFAGFGKTSLHWTGLELTRFTKERKKTNTESIHKFRRFGWVRTALIKGKCTYIISPPKDYIVELFSYCTISFTSKYKLKHSIIYYGD